MSARKGPGGMRLPQLEKLSFPLLNDFLLQNMVMVLKGVVWRETSVGSWNSTKPRIKGSLSQSQSGLETGSAKSLRWASMLALIMGSGKEGSWTRVEGCTIPTHTADAHMWIPSTKRFTEL